MVVVRILLGRVTLLLAALLGVGACAGAGPIPMSLCREAELEAVVLAGAQGDGFIAIDGMTVGPDGTAFILDGGEGSLIAFSPEGDELWRVSGMVSDGPVEIVGLHWDGEHLVVYDLGRDRLQYWTEFGELAGEETFTDLGLLELPSWIGSLGDSGVAAVVPSHSYGSEIEDTEGGLLLVGGVGAPLDTLTFLPPPRLQVLDLYGHPLPILSPYQPQPSVTVLPGGSLGVTLGDEYRIGLFNRVSGWLGEIVGSSAAPAVITEDRLAFGRLLPDTLLIDQVDLPASHPPIRGLAATADGHLLVQTSWSYRGSVRWDRWSERGEFLDSFTLPDSLAFVGGVGGLIYGIAVDPLGALQLEIYRLTGDASCPGPPPVDPSADLSV